jgi:molecular chaperone IbpA
MATFDFAPMFRSTIGFDQLPDLLSHALEREDNGYPPYNIEKLGPDSYRIVMAVAGFTRDDIEIVQAENRVTVRGAMQSNGEKTYLYRGLASRPFTREFDLADYVEVTDASLSNGLLVISLKREIPEALKPRTIPIAGEATKPAESVTFDRHAA